MILCLCPNPAVDKYIWLNALAPGQVNIPHKEEQFPGGKGVHVALGIAELGEPVILLGFWGGPTGQWIKEKCESKGITCFGPQVAGWTRTCLSIKADGDHDDTELLGIGPAISQKDFESFRETFIALSTGADCITMSGSWPKGAPHDAYAQLIALARETGKKTILDCAGEQLRAALIQKPFAVHINRREGEDLFQAASPALLASLLAEACDYAAVTAGAEGLYLAGHSEFIHARCPIEKVYSAVGSGDCLVSGLAVAIKRNLPIAQAAQLGVACGSANCIRPDLGMFYRSDVEQLQNQVVLRKYENELWNHITVPG
jgi:tagatose 6-phosphate kinase